MKFTFLGKHYTITPLFFESATFSLLLLFLPTQLGKHFWPDFSFVSGIRSDYLSPTLFFTDLLVGFLFLFWLADCFLRGRKAHIPRFHFSLKTIAISLIFLSLVSSTIFAKSIPLALYGDLKLLEMVLLSWYVARRGIALVPFPMLALLFCCGVLFESLLALAQFFHQGSIGSLFLLFGERTFTSSTPGIANASFGGELIMRPYGTLPHPNVLAGYLLIGMLFAASQLTQKPSVFRTWFFRLVLLLSCITLLLTLSRAAIIVCLLLSLAWGVFLFLKKKTANALPMKRLSFVLLISILALFMLTPIGGYFSMLFSGDESVALRLSLMHTAFSEMWQHPMVGVGLTNFLLVLPDKVHDLPYSLFALLQPVHNVYLLIGVELGLLGLMGGLVFLYGVIRQHVQNIKHMHVRSTSWVQGIATLGMLLVICLISVVDHYFWTLQQGRLLLALVIGLACVSSNPTATHKKKARIVKNRPKKSY